MARRYGQLVEVESGRALLTRIERADTAWKRTVGLLGRDGLGAQEGLWLEPCNGIHTLGMRFPIAALFLDRDGCAMRLADDLHPWRICGPVPRARIVVELRAGALAACKIQTGRHYRLE